MELSGKEVADLHKQYILQSWSKAGQDVLPVQKADGIFFYDYEGKKYADMSSLLVCSNIGHANQEVGQKIAEQALKLPFMAPAYATDQKSLLAKRVVELAGKDNFSRVLFTNGGADANENAIKMARMYTGRTKIFSAYRSYHGATLGASNASGDWRRFYSEIGGANGFVKFMNPNLYLDGYTRGINEEECTEKALKSLELQLLYEDPSNVAAILMESVVGANGVIIPPKGYLKGIRALCDKYGILFIIDEVMAGFYRTGKPFGWQNFDIVPDIMTFAKGVTAAYAPLGGVVVSTAIGKFFETHVLQCGLTYSGHTLSCAAGNAVLDFYEKYHIQEHVNKISPLVRSFMDKMVEKHECCGEARLIGLFGAFEMVKDSKKRIPLCGYNAPREPMVQLFAKLKERGFATFGRENFVELCPPLIITEAQLNEYLPIMDEVFAWVDQTYCSGQGR